jgi:hypothetical protein
VERKDLNNAGITCPNPPGENSRHAYFRHPAY